MYRGYIKSIANLTGETIGSPDLRIRNFTIREDLLNASTSEFELFSIPSAVENGNIFGVYDDYGKIVYTGVITAIEDNVIRTADILTIFDDVWLYHNPHEETIEETLKYIIENDFAQSRDSLQAEIFSQFTVTTSTSNEIDVGLESENYTINFKTWLINLYDLYGLVLTINIPYSATAPSIDIAIPTYDEITIGDNTHVVRNFSVTSTVTETNKLVIYYTNGAYRTSYYVTPSGITTDSSALDRIVRMRSKIVFSDLEDLSTVISSNIEEMIYNHKITLELLLDNSIFDFDSFHLGQDFTVYYNGDTYTTIFTGYEIDTDENGHTDYVKMTFGKVRYSLGEKLNKQTQAIGQVTNVMNSQKWITQHYDKELNEVTTTVGEVSTKADDAWDYADSNNGLIDDLSSSLSSTTTSLQTQIEQNANAITLSATKSELTTVQNALSSDIDSVESSVSALSNTVSSVEVSISSLQAAISAIQNGIGKAFVVDTTGTKVYAVENDEIIAGTYTLTDEAGNHFYVDSTQWGWATAQGFGTIKLSIGQTYNSSATAMWQIYTDSDNRLIFNWHS